MTVEALSFEEFAKRYCERQVSTPILLKATLLKQKLHFQPVGFMLLECQVMDSGRFASLTILPYGPNNTFKEPPNHPISPRGLASDTSVVVALLPAENVTAS